MEEKYLVFVVGGENDGEIIAEAETYSDAVRAAKEAEKVYGVIAIDYEKATSLEKRYTLFGLDRINSKPVEW